MCPSSAVGSQTGSLVAVEQTLRNAVPYCAASASSQGDRLGPAGSGLSGSGASIRGACASMELTFGSRRLLPDLVGLRASRKSSVAATPSSSRFGPMMRSSSGRCWAGTTDWRYAPWLCRKSPQGPVRWRECPAANRPNAGCLPPPVRAVTADLHSASDNVSASHLAYIARTTARLTFNQRTTM